MAMKYLTTTLTSLIAVFVALTLPDCSTGGGEDRRGGSGSRSDKAAFLLEYNNEYNPTSDDVGGAKLPTDVPIVWAGKHVQDGDNFSENDVFTGIATDAWKKTKIVTNLNPGEWNLSVTVNGNPMPCPSPIEAKAGMQTQVIFQVNKDTGTFDGCTHN